MGLPSRYSSLSDKTKAELRTILARYPKSDSKKRLCRPPAYIPWRRIRSTPSNSEQPVELAASSVKVSLAKGCRGFNVEIFPNDELWIRSPVKFRVVLPDDFPRAPPDVKCLFIDENQRLDKRLCGRVDSNLWIYPCYEGDEEQDCSKASACPLDDANIDENKEARKYRVDVNGAVYANILRDQMFGWVEFYSLEVVVQALVLMFKKSENELAPRRRVFKSNPKFVLKLSTGMHQSIGVRNAMEDCYFGKDLHVIASSFRIPSREFQEDLTKEIDIIGGQNTYRLNHSARRTSERKIPSSYDADLSQGPDYDTSVNVFKQKIRTRGSHFSSFSYGEDARCVPSKNDASSLYTRKVSLHAIFDGHLGSSAAEIASQIFATFFFKELEKDLLCGIESSLFSAVMQTEKYLLDKAKSELDRNGRIIDNSGTTLCALAIDLDEGVLYCANVGDSRAVLCRENGIAVGLSSDHKASIPEEIAKVANRGGYVVHDRVFGSLAVSRTLGNPGLKIPTKYITATPTITRFELLPTDEFFIVACDGVFDVLSNQEAIDYVRKSMQKHESDLNQVSADLVNHAISTLMSKDNVSVVIGKLVCSNSDKTLSDPPTNDEPHSSSFVSEVRRVFTSCFARS